MAGVRKGSDRSCAWERSPFSLLRAWGRKKTINKSIKAEKEKLKEKMKEKIDVGTFPSEFQSIFFHPWNDTKFWHIFSITSDGS